MAESSGLPGNLAFLIFVGAANADATPEQKARLKSAVVPLMNAYRDGGDPRPVLEAVTAVMGPRWRPRGKWADAIDYFLVEARQEGDRA